MKLDMKLFIAGLLTLVMSSLWASDRQAELRFQRSEVDRILGPLQLTSELSAESLQVLVDEAETQYRLGLKAQAMEGYLGIISLSPRASKAWLRVGNLHHQSGQDVEAISAYQNAVSHAGVDIDERATREKALLNISMLYLEKAASALAALEQAALDQAEKIPSDLTQKERDDIHRQLEVRQQAQELDSRAQRQVNRLRAATSRRTKVSVEAAKP